MQARSHYIEATTHQLDLWGDQFASLEQKLEGLVPAGRKALSKRIAALKLEKRALKRQLRQAAHECEHAEWNDVREELEEAVGDFRTLAVAVYDEVRGA